MNSNDRKTMDKLYTEMYFSEENLIAEDNKRIARQREANQQILELMRANGISDEEIQNFAEFIRNQKVGDPRDYEGLDRYRDRSPQ